ncbi:hydrogenase maturation protease [Streptomyces antibioticus]|uniref:hydrogenase maturation protease n=1 Tax=Streptomyces antibioticus TaxID=1890 RepID=UPI0036816EA5
MNRPAGTVVIGIGNEFRRDDGVGWAVVALLRERATEQPLPAGTALVQSDGDPGRLIGLWENAGLAVVVDACFPRPTRPGRAHRWSTATGGALRAAAPARSSTHGFGLAEALYLGDRLGRCPGRVVVYAVEGADHAPGRGLTPAVASAVPRLVRRIEGDIRRYDAAPARGVRAE